MEEMSHLSLAFNNESQQHRSIMKLQKQMKL